MGKYHVHRTDANADAIYDAARKLGMSVELIGRPVDAALGDFGVTVLAEVKTPKGKLRPAHSTHELRFRSLGGKRSKRNTVAVCGSGTTLCHGYLQRYEIAWEPLSPEAGMGEEQ